MAPLSIDSSNKYEVSLEHCIDLRPFERQLKEKQVFTRAVIEDAARITEKIRENPGTKDLVFYKDIDGKKVQIWPPEKAINKSSPGVYLKWTKFCDMAEYYLPPFQLHHPCSPGEQPDYLSMNHIKAAADKSDPEFKSSNMDITLLTSWAHQWETSNYSTALENKLYTFKNQSQIKNIICFGLGPLFHAHTSRQPRNPQDQTLTLTPSAIQHILACKIANFLQTLYAHDNPKTQPITVMAHDPNYKPQDIGLLSHLTPPIHAVSDPEHFLAINEHTLAISIFTPSTAGHWEVIADLTHPKGPAAIIANDPGMQARNLEGVCHAVVDVCTPRVATMFGKYAEMEFGSWGEIEIAERSDLEAASGFLKHMKLYTREKVGV